MQCFAAVDAHPLRQPVAVLLLAIIALAACAPRTAKTPTQEALPFIADDYPRALAEAKRTNRPLFVDAWAPWCHSCLSMRAYVLGDPALADLAPLYVWLAVDTEKPENAAFVSRFPNESWPTLWLVDPATEKPIFKWEGTATASELRELLQSTSSQTNCMPREIAFAFVRGNHALAEGDLDGAEKSFRQALATDDLLYRAQSADALVNVLRRKKDFAGCAETAARVGPALAAGTNRADVLAMGLSCAIEAKRADDAKALEEHALRIAIEGDDKTLADDRSALFEEVVAAREAAGDDAGKKAVAAKWAAFLEREAANAKSNEARAVFDAHRLSAYIALGDPSRAIAMLAQSEREFPEDYNPPARLARAYLELARLDDARAAIERAASRVYGPRALRVFALAADIAKARKDRAAERHALERALSKTEGTVLSEGQKKLRASLAKRLAEL